MARRTKAASATEVRTDAPSDPFSLQTIYCGDNLDKLSRMPSKCVDLIYIDPPFNSNRNYEVFWGEAKEKRAFEDRHASTEAYIQFMEPRCIQIHRILKDTGSFYYHCDWHACHYVKVMLDRIFGANNFRNEIVWRRASAHNDPKKYGNIHDNIFYYVKSKSYTWNVQYTPYTPEYIKAEWRQLPSGRFYKCENMLDPRGSMAEFDFEGTRARWRTGPEGMRKLWNAPQTVVPESHGRIKLGRNGKPTKRCRIIFLDDMPGVPLQGWWDDLKNLAGGSNERIGYPTQKPLPLLERIIKASSDPDDVVLDAFCGCGTALEAAQRLDRRWIGIDISPTSCRVMSDRLKRNCHLIEGRDFFVRDLPKTAEQLRSYPHFEFENWAVNALNTVLVNGHAIGNKAKVNDKGIDGRIYPIRADKTKTGEMDLFGPTDDWLPVQVKQVDVVNRNEIDTFYGAMKRQKRDKGFFISFAFSSGALKEMQRLHDDPENGLEIIPLTVDEILAEEVRYRV